MEDERTLKATIASVEMEREDLLKYAEDRVSSCRVKIEDLTHKLNGATMELDRYVDLSARRLEVIRCLEKEIEYLETQHEMKLEAERGDYRMQLAESLNGARLLAITQCDLEKNYHIVESNQNVLKLSNIEKRELITALDGRYRKCKRIKEAAEALSTERLARINELGERLTSKDAEIGKLLAKIEQMEESQAAGETLLQKERTSHREEVSKLEAAMSDWENARKLLEDSKERLEQEKGELRVQISALEEQLAGFNESIIAKVGAMEQREQEIASLRDQLSQKKEEYLALEFDRDEAKHQAHMRTEQLASLEGEHATVLKQLAELRTKYSREAAEWEKRKDDLKKFAAECDEAVSEWKNKFHDMREQLFSTREGHAVAMDKLKDELRDSLVEQASLKTRIVQLETAQIAQSSSSQTPRAHAVQPPVPTLKRIRKNAKQAEVDANPTSQADSLKQSEPLLAAEDSSAQQAATPEKSSEDNRKRRRILHARKTSSLLSPKRQQNSLSSVENIFSAFAFPNAEAVESAGGSPKPGTVTEGVREDVPPRSSEAGAAKPNVSAS